MVVENIFTSLKRAFFCDFNLLYLNAGPDHWADHYPACGGVRQSPVNIDSTVALKGVAEMFMLSPPYGSGQVMELTNNGHSGNYFLYYVATM